MSKEFPFFRFYSSEWLTDEISFESYASKGVFIDVCAFYWSRGCDVDNATLQRKFSNAKKSLDLLFDVGLIKTSENGNKIVIKFLDEQLDYVRDEKKKRREAGITGGKASAEARSRRATI